MTTVAELLDRNTIYYWEEFSSEANVDAWGDVLVIGCLDARVDPAHVLGLGIGEATVLRNVGGRVTPAILHDLVLIEGMRSSPGQSPVDPCLLLVLHHTDCALAALAPQLLADHFGIPVDLLDTKSVHDPHGSVLVDVDVLLAHKHARRAVVAGLVYDVDTGRATLVVQPIPLEPA